MFHNHGTPITVSFHELMWYDSWDEYYERDIKNEISASRSLSEVESWFDDVGAPEKVADYLTSPDFPLFAQHTRPDLPAVLDVGTGNGSTLISLAVDYGIKAHMVGIDYSAPSVQLARQLWSTMRDSAAEVGITTIDFDVFDLLNDSPQGEAWWPASSGFDLVLDKGTFDAISLSAEAILGSDGTARKPAELYPSKIASLTKSNGYFLITSCNWTEAEVISRFTTGELAGVFEVFHRIKYPKYSFGGHEGQGVASVCFRKLK
jgi:EEF1A lysine methyltransferase 2